MDNLTRTGVKLLLQYNVPYRDIASVTGVSLGFISKCKRQVAEGWLSGAAPSGAPSKSRGRGSPRSLPGRLLLRAGAAAPSGASPKPRGRGSPRSLPGRLPLRAGAAALSGASPKPRGRGRPRSLSERDERLLLRALSALRKKSLYFRHDPVRVCYRGNISLS